VKVKQNIGILNALIRLTCGFTILSWATAKMVKRPWDQSYLLMTFLAAMKIGEGIVRYCPVTALYQEGKEAVDKSGEFADENGGTKQLAPYIK
jgi:hypothetical protein